MQRTQGADGFWAEERYTATGFPRVFYLRYHGYPKFFPLWALARYRNLRASGSSGGASECDGRRGRAIEIRPLRLVELGDKAPLSASAIAIAA